jgi:hypothetical protein
MELIRLWIVGDAEHVRDAMRVIADITFFKGEQARVEQFERAVERLTAQDKQILAPILSEKLASPAG